MLKRTMPSYLTEYPYVGHKYDAGVYFGVAVPSCPVSTGPRIEASTWQEAEEKLSVLVAFGMVHPETCIIDRLEEE